MSDASECQHLNLVLFPDPTHRPNGAACPDCRRLVWVQIPKGMSFDQVQAALDARRLSS